MKHIQSKSPLCNARGILNDKHSLLIILLLGYGVTPYPTKKMNECPICLVSAPVINYKTPCGHEFHSPCLGRWLLQANTCPVCREDLTHEGVLPEDMIKNLKAFRARRKCIQDDYMKDLRKLHAYLNKRLATNLQIAVDALNVDIKGWPAHRRTDLSCVRGVMKLCVDEIMDIHHRDRENATMALNDTYRAILADAVRDAIV